MSLIIDLENIVWTLEHDNTKKSAKLAKEYRAAITLLVTGKNPTNCKFPHVIEDLVISKGFDDSLEVEYSAAIEKLNDVGVV